MSECIPVTWAVYMAAASVALAVVSASYWERIARLVVARRLGISMKDSAAVENTENDDNA